MINIHVLYEGDLHCTATHEPSSATLETDAPVDNHGRGASFSPTDLLATALATCMVTVMGIQAKKKGWAIEGTRVHVQKHMTPSPPRRVAKLLVRVELGPGAATLADAERRDLEHAAHTCPVRLSLLDAIEVPVEFVWK